MRKSDDDGIVVAFGLGSNRGDREAALCLATRSLALVLNEIQVSSPYLSTPLYDTTQPAFLNAVLVGLSLLDVEQLTGLAKAIERTAGRRAGRRYGPRRLDIDLLVYGETVIDRPELSVPHRCLREREFVLAPLAEVAPTLRIPPDGSNPVELLATVDGQQGVVKHEWSLRCRKLMP